MIQGTKIGVNHGVKYDLAGKLVDETGLTRKAIVYDVVDRYESLMQRVMK